MKLKNNIILLALLLPLIGFSQDFHYKTEIDNVSDEWHKIILNKDILSQLKTDLSDIRIYEVSSKKDTLEVPYFIETKENSVINKGVNFKIINQTKKGDDYFITLKVKNKLEINEINLSLDEDNYNYQIDLEASQNQKEWFLLAEDYRILSIKNQLTNYKFNKISFPKAEYKFYRVKIKNADKVNLKSASMQYLSLQKGDYTEYRNSWDQEEKDNKTLATINLKSRVPVSTLDLKLSDDKDFYRIIKIKYLLDSVKTDKGWYYNYKTVAQGYLSSLENAEYKFETVFTNKLQIEILNNDNQALNIKTIKIQGPEYKLTARFNQTGESYYMLFGNEKIRRANYDIINFKKNIPEDLKELKAGSIIDLIKEKEPNKFLNNKIFLWIILLIIILVLGGASYSMLKKKE